MNHTKEELEKKLEEKAGKDEEFRERLINDPRGTVEETFWIRIPDDQEITVSNEKGGKIKVSLPFINRIINKGDSHCMES